MAALTPEQEALIAARDRLQAATPADISPVATVPSSAVPVPAPKLTAAQEQFMADKKNERAAKEAQRVRLEAGGIGQQLQDQGIALAKSSGRGFAKIVDLPPVIAAGIQNLLVNRPTGRPLADPQNPYGGDPAPTTALFDKYLGAPNPKYPELNQFGEMFGPTAVTLGAAAPEASLIGTGARAAVMTGGAKIGGDVVGGIGEKLFGEPGRTYGTLAGNIIGGGIGPPAVSTVGTRIANKALTVPETIVGGRGGGAAGAAVREFQPGAGGSANWLRAADALGIGDQMSLDILGNRLAQVLPDIATYIPFAGKPALAARVRQGAALDKANAILAEKAYGGPIPRGPITPEGIGQDLIDMSQVGSKRATKGIERIYEDPVTGLYPRLPAGRETIIDPTGVQVAHAQLRGSPSVSMATQGGTLTNSERMLEADRRFPINEGLHQQLLAKKARLEANPTTPPTEIDAVNAEIDANKGVSFDNMRKQRDAGNRTDTGVALDKQLQKDLRVARTTTMQKAAEDHGVSAADFKRIEDAARELIVRRNLVETVGGNPNSRALPPSQGSAFTKLFGTAGSKNLTLLRAFKDLTPTELRQAMAKQYELETRGQTSAGAPLEINPKTGETVGNARTFDPVAAAAFWAKRQHPAVREALTDDPALQRQMDAAATLAHRYVGRPGRAAPGKGSTSVNAASNYYQLPLLTQTLGALAGGGGVAGTAATAGIAAALKAAGLLIPGMAIPRFVSGRLTDPAFSRRVINSSSLPAAWANTPSLANTLTRAVGEVGRDIGAGVNRLRPSSRRP